MQKPNRNGWAKYKKLYKSNKLLLPDLGSNLASKD